MKRSATTILVLLALSACGGGREAPRVAAEDTRPEAEACRAEARQSPEARRLWSEYVPGNIGNEHRVAEARRVAELRAYRDCMRRIGASMPGGVEPVRRSF